MFKYFLSFFLIVVSTNLSLAEEGKAKEKIVDGSSDGRVKVITSESKSYVIEKIDKLEKNLDKLEKYIYNSKTGTGSGTASSISANALVQIDELHENIKELRGSFENLEHKLDELSQKFANFAADVEYRFSETKKMVNQQDHDNKILNSIDKQLDDDVFSNKLNDQSALKKDGSPFSRSATDQQAVSPEEQYQKAYALIKEKKYAEAKDSFKQFIAKNSATQLAGNAYFWLGEIEFSQNNIEDAAVQYLRGYQSAPAGTKAADNLLKLGISLKKLDKRKEACITFTKLDKEFPEMPTMVRKRLNAETKELACE
jgi:tol-pal system protein YbgF